MAVKLSPSGSRYLLQDQPERDGSAYRILLAESPSHGTDHRPGKKAAVYVVARDSTEKPLSQGHFRDLG